MVAAVRKGQSQRTVARNFQVALSTVQYWVAKAAGLRLDRVQWDDAPRGGRRAKAATSEALENLILRLRRQLQERSDLGECGAVAIERELRKRRKHVPSVRTIGRILARRGALDGRTRVRRPPPPRGWYLPDVAVARAELDSFDFVDGLTIRGGVDVMVLNAISLHGCLCASFIRSAWTAKFTVEALLEHWQARGLPAYAQFDNDTLFQGAHQWPNSFGRVTRLCLQLGVTPVFAPPRETGIQAQIESYNGRWQAKVWHRFEHPHIQALSEKSARYVRAANERHAPRADTAPARRPFPKSWQLDLAQPLAGTVIFLRRTNDQGQAALLGQSFPVDPLWPHRLVRAEVDLTKHRIRFYRLRRRQPDHQPLITSVKYQPPTKPFQDK